MIVSIAKNTCVKSHLYLALWKDPLVHSVSFFDIYGKHASHCLSTFPLLAKLVIQLVRVDHVASVGGSGVRAHVKDERHAFRHLVHIVVQEGSLLAACNGVNGRVDGRFAEFGLRLRKEHEAVELQKSAPSVFQVAKGEESRKDAAFRRARLVDKFVLFGIFGAVRRSAVNEHKGPNIQGKE